jgi:hypothetical protein
MINVSIKGNKLFDWTGNAEEAGLLDEEMRELANDCRVTPEQFASVIVADILKRGGLDPQLPGEMPILTWMLLSQSTGNPDLPGSFRDYVETWDFDFDISSYSGSRRLRVEVNATMPNGDEWSWLN